MQLSVQLCNQRNNKKFRTYLTITNLDDNLKSFIWTNIFMCIISLEQKIALRYCASTLKEFATYICFEKIIETCVFDKLSLTFNFFIGILNFRKLSFTFEVLIYLGCGLQCCQIFIKCKYLHFIGEPDLYIRPNPDGRINRKLDS